jgi:hypothetical protein
MTGDGGRMFIRATVTTHPRSWLPQYLQAHDFVASASYEVTIEMPNTGPKRAATIGLEIGPPPGGQLKGKPVKLRDASYQHMFEGVKSLSRK